MTYAEQETERLREVLERWGMVLVARGEMTPEQFYADYTGSGFVVQRPSSDLMAQLAQLYAPYRKVGPVV